jgi:isopentenyldiphosphate isomerase
MDNRRYLHKIVGLLDSRHFGALNQRKSLIKIYSSLNLKDYSVAEKVSLPYNLCRPQALSDFMHSTRLSLERASLQSLFDDLLSRANQPPQTGSLPLFVGGHRCGWLFSKAAQALSGLEGVELKPDHAHIGRLVDSKSALNALLASVANTLRTAGCAPGWRNELLDVWMDNDHPEAASDLNKPIAAIERGIVRPLGLITRAVHLSGWSSDGGLWVARRALTKATDPGMWDTLVGGLISSQEDLQTGLVRESDEEAGLDPQDIANRTPLRTITRMRRQVPEGYQAEDVLTCECVLPASATPKNRDGEVMEIKLLAPSTIFNMLKEGAFTLEASIVLTEDLLRRSETGSI